MLVDYIKMFLDRFVTPDPVQGLPRAADFEQDGDGEEGYTGNDTTGLFLEDGTILVEEPPGDTTAYS